MQQSNFAATEAMEFVQPVFEIVKGVWRPISRRVGYAVHLENNFKKLKERVLKLGHKRDDIKDRIDLVKQQKAPTRECKDWLADVEEMETKVKQIEDEHLVQKRCFKGWFPDVFGRVKLGKQVVEMIECVRELQERSKFEGGFVDDLPLAKVEEVCIPTLGAKTSVDHNLKLLVDYIKDEEKPRIGIWGMGGVGKTTLLKLLNNMPEVEDMFQIVIWATVSKSWSIRNIQDQVANRLKLDIRGKSNVEASRMIFHMLKSSQYLLLLDDVWEGLDLSDVGIPNPSQSNGCKVVLTTREFRVCREMGTNVEMKVEALPEEEAWEIFYSKVGEIATFPAINPIAKEIVRECGGLPLALNIIGGTLAKVRDVYVWRNLLKKLKSPDTSVASHPSERVFESLKVSYDQLKDTNTKNCFLYCSLYPEDHNIDKSELISYWRAEGLLSSSSRGTLEDARDEGHQLFHDLTDASLLEESEDDEKHVKVHDVVRDLVLKMTFHGGSEECRHVVKAGLRYDEEIVIEDKEWEMANRISFMFTKRYRLPENPNCPNLSTLLLQPKEHDIPLRIIPESFFNQMPKLRVLDLSNAFIPSLPSSVANLVNLRALFLKLCYKLTTLPRELSALKKLEVLCVVKSNVMHMPREILELSSLKCLQFSYCFCSLGFSTFMFGEETSRSVTYARLSTLILPPNAGEISKLSQLEEVSVIGNLQSHQIVKACVEGLCRLPRLSSLEFNFVTVDNLQHFLQNSYSWRHHKLMEFCFVVGEITLEFAYIDEHFKERWKRCLSYQGTASGDGSNTDSSILPSAIKEVLVHCVLLELHGHGELRKLSDLGTENTDGLKYLRVNNCAALEMILDEERLQVGDFAHVECLDFTSLHALKCICDYKRPLSSSESPPQLAKQLISNSFTSLRRLIVARCNKLKTLFWHGLLPQLHNLEHFGAVQCPELEEMVSDGDGFNYILPKIKFLDFEALPMFVGLSKGKFTLHCPQLEEIRFYGCEKLEMFPFTVHDAPNLKQIVIESKWWEGLKWEDEAAKFRFTPLCLTFG